MIPSINMRPSPRVLQRPVQCANGPAVFQPKFSGGWVGTKTAAGAFIALFITALLPTPKEKPTFKTEEAQAIYKLRETVGHASDALLGALVGLGAGLGSLLKKPRDKDENEG